MSKEDSKDKYARLKEFIKRFSGLTEDQQNEIKERSGRIVTCEGHTISTRNYFMLEEQAKFIGANVTMIGGYRQWEKLGRQVRKGEKSLSILVPCNVKDAETDENGKKMFFRFVSVFDVSQTDEQLKQISA